jgi:hypothetical protein
MKEYGCCPKFKRRDNSTYTFTKRGVVYLVSATPTKLLICIFMKLYTFVVHYLQMCMKEYGCCPKFRRGDNSTFYETLHSCSTQPADVHEGLPLLSKI